MAEFQRQKRDAFRMRLRREVDLQTFKAVTKEIDTALDQLDREHKSLTSEAAMPELPDPSLAWEDLSADDRRALTEMLVDKIIIRAAPEQDRQGRQAPLPHPRHPIPRSRARGRAAEEGARGSGQDRPQGLSNINPWLPTIVLKPQNVPRAHPDARIFRVDLGASSRKVPEVQTCTTRTTIRSGWPSRCVFACVFGGSGRRSRRWRRVSGFRGCSGGPAIHTRPR